MFERATRLNKMSPTIATCSPAIFPRSDGTFLISRAPTCLNALAVSRIKLISSAGSSRRPSKSFRVQRVVIFGERTRLVPRLRGRERVRDSALFFEVHNSEHVRAEAKLVLARRRNQRARRACSPG